MGKLIFKSTSLPLFKLIIMKQYFPSNGTESSNFFDYNCDKCYKFSTCTIIKGFFLGKQPKQWVYDDDGLPICTSYKSNSERYRSKKKQISKMNQRTLF